MADKDDPAPLSVRLMPEDHAWLAMVALREDMSVPALLNRAVRHFRNWQRIVDDVLRAIDDLCGEYQEQVRRQLYFQRMCQIQVRRQHDLRRAYGRKLWNERRLRRAYERKLLHERDLRRAYEELLQRQSDYYERRLTAGTAPSTLYSWKVSRLVALALSSGSEAEAAAALAKARKLHHLAA